MSDSCIKYTKSRRAKDHRQDPTFKKMFVKQQGLNAIILHAVAEIIFQKKEKLGVKDETHDNIDNKVCECELYGLEKRVLMKNK